jgi:hypothetical protein
MGLERARARAFDHSDPEPPRAWTLRTASIESLMKNLSWTGQKFPQDMSDADGQ